MACIAALIGGVFALPAFSAELVVNGNFETPVIQPTDHGGVWQLYTTAQTNWSHTDPAMRLELQTLYATCGVACGTQYAELDGDQEGDPTRPRNTTIYQDLVGAVDGTLYTLSFWFASRPGNGTSTMEVFWGVNDANFWTAPDMIITSPAITGSPNWTFYAFNFVAGANTRIAFRAAGTDDGNGEFLDLVSVQEAVIPEPATMMLSGGALIGLSLLRLRKRIRR